MQLSFPSCNHAGSPVCDAASTQLVVDVAHKHLLLVTKHWHDTIPSTENKLRK